MQTKMKVLEYTVKFVTPAFLGNADQAGQWRTPPFKAQLRQWWRVAYAARCGFKVDTKAMRREEGLLFGHAWLDDDKDECGNKVAARKSEVRIRLNNPLQSVEKEAWAFGTQKGVAPLSDGLDTSYAWFGLIKRGGGLPDRSAIKPSQGEGVRRLSIAIPAEYEERLKEVISLISAFGLLGSRSRGGWGALHIAGEEEISPSNIKKYARPLQTCLQDDWAMSLAHDSRLGIWQSASSFDTWDKAMRFIATERKNVRTSLKGANGLDLRAALGFASPGRMPSPLRWKVIPKGDKLVVRAFAMPHRIPDDGGVRMPPDKLATAWKTAFSTLDNSARLARLEQ